MKQSKVIKPPQKPYPSGWGSDSLTDILKACTENMYATYQKEPQYFSMLQRVDALFKLCVESFHNSPKWGSALFFLQAHSCYLAACRLVCSSQIPEGFQVLRGMLENGLYGYFVDEHPELKEVWWRREESPANKKAVKEKFVIGSIFKDLAKKDKKIHQVSKGLYESLIDHGGHPNERAMSSRLEKHETDKEVEFRLKCLNPKPEYIRFGIIKTATVGMIVIKIFEVLHPERFKLSGLDEKWHRLIRDGKKNYGITL